MFNNHPLQALFGSLAAVSYICVMQILTIATPSIGLQHAVDLFAISIPLLISCAFGVKAVDAMSGLKPLPRRFTVFAIVSVVAVLCAIAGVCLAFASISNISAGLFFVSMVLAWNVTFYVNPDLPHKRREAQVPPKSAP